jgi:COP9 signalosome complex subunit 4
VALADQSLTPAAVSTSTIMENKLAQFASLSQKDKAPAYLSLLPEILSRSNPSAIATDLHSLVDTVVNQDSVGLVVGRQVLSELVKSLDGGAIKDSELRKRIVEDTLATIQPRIVSYEEQVSMNIIYNAQMILKDPPR